MEDVLCNVKSFAVGDKVRSLLIGEEYAIGIVVAVNALPFSRVDWQNGNCCWEKNSTLAFVSV